MLLSSTKDGAAARVDNGRPILTIVCSALGSGIGIGERSSSMFGGCCGGNWQKIMTFSDSR